MDYFYDKVDANNIDKWEKTASYNKDTLLTEKEDNATIVALSDAIKSIILKCNIKNKIASELDACLTARNSQIDDVVALFDDEVETLNFDQVIES